MNYFNFSFEAKNQKNEEVFPCGKSTKFYDFAVKNEIKEFKKFCDLRL